MANANRHVNSKLFCMYANRTVKRCKTMKTTNNIHCYSIAREFIPEYSRGGGRLRSVDKKMLMMINKGAQYGGGSWQRNAELMKMQARTIICTAEGSGRVEKGGWENGKRREKWTRARKATSKWESYVRGERKAVRLQHNTPGIDKTLTRNGEKWAKWQNCDNNLLYCSRRCTKDYWELR